jgi:hypothetical protein
MLAERLMVSLLGVPKCVGSSVGMVIAIPFVGAPMYHPDCGEVHCRRGQSRAEGDDFNVRRECGNKSRAPVVSEDKTVRGDGILGCAGGQSRSYPRRRRRS